MILFMIVLGQSLFTKDSLFRLLVPSMSKMQMYEGGDLAGIFLLSRRYAFACFRRVKLVDNFYEYLNWEIVLLFRLWVY